MWWISINCLQTFESWERKAGVHLYRAQCWTLAFFVFTLSPISIPLPRVQSCWERRQALSLSNWVEREKGPSPGCLELEGNEAFRLSSSTLARKKLDERSKEDFDLIILMDKLSFSHLIWRVDNSESPSRSPGRDTAHGSSSLHQHQPFTTPSTHPNPQSYNSNPSTQK